MNLNEKKEEIIFRIQHQSTLYEKVKLGIKLQQEFVKALDKNYPLFVLGHDKLGEILRENENCNEFYIKKVRKTFQCSTESITGAKKVNRDHIIDTKSALTHLDQIDNIIQSFQEEIEFNELIKKSQKKGDVDKQKAFLIDALFSDKIKKLPKSSTLSSRIEQKIDELKGVRYANETIAESKKNPNPEKRISYLVRAKHRIPPEYRKLNDIVVRFIDEEIEVIKETRLQLVQLQWLWKNHRNEIDITQLCILIKGICLIETIGKNGKPLQQTELIKIFENLFGIEIKNFRKLLKQGLTSEKSQNKHICKDLYEAIEQIRISMAKEE